MYARFVKVAATWPARTADWGSLGALPQDDKSVGHDVFDDLAAQRGAEVVV